MSTGNRYPLGRNSFVHAKVLGSSFWSQAIAGGLYGAGDASRSYSRAFTEYVLMCLDGDIEHLYDALLVESIWCFSWVSQRTTNM